MTFVVFCENGHRQQYDGLSSVPKNALRGFRNMNGDEIVWKCKTCGKTAIRDPTTGEFAATASGGMT